MSAKITVVSIDGVLVEGAVGRTTLREVATGACARIADAVWEARRRFGLIEEVRLLREGTTAGVPMRGVRSRDRFLTLVAVGAVVVLMAILAPIVY